MRKIILILSLIICLNNIAFCNKVKYAVIISANMEWKAVNKIFPKENIKKSIWGEDLRKELQSQGIHIRAGSMAGLAEEAPQAYKDVDEVVEIVHGAGIASKVARLRPVAVIKG